jgi:DNA-binding NarL/FixJ family response regulator
MVGIAISGEEAVAMAGESHPDIVFMDIQLEGRLSGTEAAQAIQERIGARIVFVTAFPDIFLRDMSHLKEAGICVKKPFTRSQLEIAVSAAAASSEKTKKAGENAYSHRKGSAYKACE